MDWAGIIASKLVEEEEMSILSAGFVARMHKRATDLKGESTPISDGKRPNRSFPDEETWKD